MLIILDFILDRMSKEKPHYPLVKVIRAVIAFSLIWLIVAFFAQIYMGWITFPE